MTVPQLGKKLSTFYGARRFIITLTRTPNVPIRNQKGSIHAPPTDSFKIQSNIILLRPLGLPSGLLPTAFPTKTLYGPLLSPMHATCPALLTSLDLIPRIIFAAKYNHEALQWRKHFTKIMIRIIQLWTCQNEELYFSGAVKLLSPLLHFHCQFHDTHDKHGCHISQV